MATCPNCNTGLATVRETEGLYYYCNQCGGRAATTQQIRRTVGDRYISKMVRGINIATESSFKPCPFCTVPMKLLQVPAPPLTLDSCRTCGMVWFDAGQFEQLPAGSIDTPENALARALGAEAQWKIEQQQARARGIQGGAPDEWWKWIPAFLGLPVKFDAVEMSQRPWATWILSAMIVFISFWGFFDLQDAVKNFGMVPAEAWRYGGATFLTSFFIHGGFFHLFSNLYFFILFGGEVETCLGRWRFLALIFLSHFIGSFFHILGNLHATIPCIGASGGISGVLVFYALQFPNAKLVFFWWRFGWIHLPAWSAFFLWFLLQLVGVAMQRAGLSHVSSMAHLGGVATGFVSWLWWRKLGTKKEEQET